MSQDSDTYGSINVFMCGHNKINVFLCGHYKINIFLYGHYKYLQQGMDQPGIIANPVGSQPNKRNECTIFHDSCPRPLLRNWCRETGSAPSFSTPWVRDILVVIVGYCTVISIGYSNSNNIISTRVTVVVLIVLLVLIVLVLLTIVD